MVESHQWDCFRFENARPPGMYKDEYIQTLFNYYHEQRDDAQTLTPMLPVWKVENGDDSPEHFDDNAPGATSMAGAPHPLSRF